jgi:uncharacterized OB-fold protein
LSEHETTEKESFERHYPWDIPQYNKIARFFSALKESKIESTRCKKCGTIQWPPRSICSKCLSDDLDWVEIPRQGTIVSFSRAYIGMVDGEVPPILVAAIQLENGLRLLSRIINAKYEDLQIGMKVKFAKSALVEGKPYWSFEPDPGERL